MGKGIGVFALLLAVAAGTAQAADRDGLAETAYEARQVIAVIEWFYVRNRTCPTPSRAAELATFRDRLGDGYSAEPHGPFIEIRGISMAEPWRYYASAAHPESCTLLRRLDGDGTLIWRSQRGIGRWTFDPGDGRPERSIKPVR